MIDNNLKTLTVVHINCYTADIDGKDIISFYEDSSIITVTLKNDYQYESNGFLRWKSIEPFDKDEIASISLKFKNGEIKNIGVPFKDVSSNGALCINEKSKIYEDESSITIEWQKIDEFI